jgi:hypothetical protein
LFFPFFHFFPFFSSKKANLKIAPYLQFFHSTTRAFSKTLYIEMDYTAAPNNIGIGAGGGTRNSSRGFGLKVRNPNVPTPSSLLEQEGLLLEEKIKKLQAIVHNNEAVLPSIAGADEYRSTEEVIIASMIQQEQELGAILKDEVNLLQNQLDSKRSNNRILIQMIEENESLNKQHFRITAEKKKKKKRCPSASREVEPRTTTSTVTSSSPPFKAPYFGRKV